MLRHLVLFSAIFAFPAAYTSADDSFPLTDAEELVAEDAEQIIEELRTLSSRHGEHEWLDALMRLSDLGPAAIPAIDKALHETTVDEDPLKRRLLLVLRTFDDVRAVPTVIRFIPRLAEPTGSDMGMLITAAQQPSDDLANWLTEHCDGHRADGGLRYDYHRPINEAFATLKKLTGKQFGIGEIRFMEFTGDATRDNAIAKIFHSKAERWADWWNENARTLTDDERYHAVTLPVFVEKRGPSPLDDGVVGEVVARRSNVIVAPLVFEGDYCKCFYDLDTGRQFDGRNRWQGEPLEAIDEWAAKEGFDLMTVEREDNGATTYALRPLDANFWQIDRAAAASIEPYLKKEKQLVLGEVGDLLLDYDADTKTYGDNPKPAFLYETNDGSVGVILIDSDVTQLFIQDENGKVINGGPVSEVPGSRGFYHGVKMSLRTIGVKADKAE